MTHKVPKYHDLKYKYIRGLVALESTQRRHHFMKSAAEWTAKAIVSLELHNEPIKSVHQATQLEGVGAQVGQKLCGIEKDERHSSDHPPPGKFLTSGPALLVGLLNATRDLRTSTSEKNSPSKGKCAKTDVIPEEIVVERAKELCKEKFKENKSDPGFCPALGRMQSLITRGCVKKRTLKKQPAYELLPFGEQLALSLIGTKTSPTTPSKQKKVSPRKELGNVNQNLDTLYTNDTMTNGLILLVDTQEWGGDRVGLGRLAQLFGRSGVTYRTKRLSHGDYQWIWRCNNKEWTMPLLVERKRADDLAHSMVDGRFFNQIENMRRWCQQFAHQKSKGSLKYLIEGDPEQYVVRCMDGCRGVGKCQNPNPEVLQDAIDNLDRGNDVDVIRTENMQGSIDILVMITAELKHRISLGEFDELFATAISRDLNAENQLLGFGGMEHGQPALNRMDATLAKPKVSPQKKLNDNRKQTTTEKKHYYTMSAENKQILPEMIVPPKKRKKSAQSVTKIKHENSFLESNINVSQPSFLGLNSGTVSDYSLSISDSENESFAMKKRELVSPYSHRNLDNNFQPTVNQESNPTRSKYSKDEKLGSICRGKKLAVKKRDPDVLKPWQSLDNDLATCANKNHFISSTCTKERYTDDFFLDSGSGEEDIVSTAKWMREQKEKSTSASAAAESCKISTESLALASDTNSEDEYPWNSYNSNDPVVIPESDFVDNEPPVPCQSRLLDLNDDFLPDLVQPDSAYFDLGDRDGIISQGKSPTASGSSSKNQGSADSTLDLNRAEKYSCKRKRRSKTLNAGKVYLMKRRRSRSDSCSSTEKFNVGGQDQSEHSRNSDVDSEHKHVSAGADANVSAQMESECFGNSDAKGRPKCAKVFSDENVPQHDKMSQIRAVLPQVAEKLIKKKLCLFDGDVESTILALLEQGDNVTSSDDFDVIDLT